MSQHAIKILTRGAYDLQKLRISTGNRIAANFRAKLGQAPGQKEAEGMSAEDMKMVADLKTRFRRITDAIAIRPRNAPFPGDEVISSYAELAMIGEYLHMEELERDNFKHLEKALGDMPIYTQFLKGVKGVGPAMAGVIVSEFDITKAKYASCLWRYAGLDLGPDGKGRSKRQEHLVEREYVTKDGEVKTRMGVTYNPFLKTKLVGVLGGSFLRSASPYAELYRQYRHRIESDPAREKIAKWDADKPDAWTPLRIHRASIRYMVKIFLIDLYKAWRAMEGLEVHAPYSEGKLGHKHAA